MKAKDIMTEKVLTLSADSKVSQALSIFGEKRVHSIPIVNGKKYQGMLIYRDLIRRRSIQFNSKASGYVTSTPVISPEDDVLTVIDKIRSSGIAALPVLAKGSLTGIISTADIVRKYNEIVRDTGLTAMDVMSSDPIAVRETDALDIAHDKIRILREYEIPVVDDRGHTAGILRLDDMMERAITEKDKISYGQYKSTSAPVKVQVGSVMDNDVHAMTDTPVSECADLMTEHSLHIIPVTDREGMLVGVVSQSDLIGIINTNLSQEGLLMTISGLDHGDEDLYDMAYRDAEKFAKKFSKITGHSNGTLSVHVIRYKEEGSTKYSVRTRLISGGISLTVDSFDWNFGKCLYDIFETYENRLRKMKEKKVQ